MRIYPVKKKKENLYTLILLAISKNLSVSRIKQEN
jgi:hypothetical protein